MGQWADDRRMAAEKIRCEWPICGQNSQHATDNEW